MFKYFPTNYVWNLSVDLAIEMAARILDLAGRAIDALLPALAHFLLKPGRAVPETRVRAAVPAGVSR